MKIKNEDSKLANSYETLYRKNKKNGRVIIDISLNDYLEFFHEWDNSAFRKRDIHGELAQFLDVCSLDIPIRKTTRDCFYVRECGKDTR